MADTGESPFARRGFVVYGGEEGEERERGREGRGAERGGGGRGGKGRGIIQRKEANREEYYCTLCRTLHADATPG